MSYTDADEAAERELLHYRKQGFGSVEEGLRADLAQARTTTKRDRIIQGVSFSPDDPLIPKVKALVRERNFSKVCKLALTAWFEEDEVNIRATLERIEAKLTAMGFPPTFQHGPTGTSLDNAAPLRRETIPETIYGDAEGASAAADALGSY